MTLGAKVKEIFHSEDTHEGQPTPHPPGYFPADDMAPSESHQGYSKGYEQEHNKLHKFDDPRGWSQDDNTSRGHGYKDSGVGLTESRDPSSFNRPGETTSERRNDPLERTAETTTAGGLADNSNLASQQSGSGPTESATRENPYWGDLPSKAVGPDSAQSEAERHRAVHTGATQPTTISAPLESGKFPTAQRKERESETSPSTTNPYNAQRQAQENPQQRTSDSHFKEGLAGAGAAGTAAYGAHELNKRRDAKDDPSQLDQPTTTTTSTTTTTTTQPEEHKEHKGRSFPLLNREHKEPKDKHHEKEEKHAKEPKEKHESRFGALFHRRGSKDEPEPVAQQEPAKEKHHHSKAAPALAAAGAGGAATYAATRDRSDNKDQRDPTTSQHQDPAATRTTRGSGLDSSKDHHPITGPASQSYQQDDSHRGAGLATGAAAGLGAGALASRSGHHDTDRRDQPSALGSDQRYDPLGSHSTRDPATQSYQKDDSHRGAGLATGAAAGLGAGALASRSGHRDTDRRDQPSALGSDQRYDPQGTHTTRDPTMQSHQKDDSYRGAGALASHYGQRDSDRSAQPSGLDSGRGYNEQSSHTMPESTSQSYQQGDSHRGAGLASGTAAGLGAGALASHHGQRRDNDRADQPTGLESTRGYGDQGSYATREPTTQSYQQGDSHRGTGLASGTAAGLGAGALASHAGQHRDSDRTGYSTGQDQSRDYNAPSGQNIPESTSQSHQQQDSHRGTGLATGAAAGLGAGVLASRYGRHHDSEADRTEKPFGLSSGRGSDLSSNYSSDPSARDPALQSHQQHDDSHRGTGLATGAAAGLGAGALASRAGQHSDTDRTGQTGLDSSRPMDTYSSDPSSQTYAQQESSRGSGLGTGAAAGLGAGALASHLHRDHKSDASQYSTDTKRSEPHHLHHTGPSIGEPTGQSYQQESSHRGGNLGAGTARGMGAGGLASHEMNKGRENEAYSIQDNNRGYQSGTTGTGSAMGATQGLGQDVPRSERERHSQRDSDEKPHHTFTDNANEGKYNTLSSGTPSGIRDD